MIVLYTGCFCFAKIRADDRILWIGGIFFNFYAALPHKN